MNTNGMAKGEATKQRIIAAAADLIHRQGFNATGLNQIIKNSGTPKGSLYFHFPEGKEEIIEAALQASGNQMSQLLTQVFDQSPDPRQAINHCIAYLKQELVATEFRKGCPVATVALEASGEISRIQKVCADIYKNWTSILERGLGESGARQAGIVLMLIEGALVLSKANRSTEPLDICAAHLSVLLTEAQ